MDDNNVSYIHSTSDYINGVKPSFVRITDKLKNVAKIINKMDSPKQTKAQTKEALTEELTDTVSELRKVVQSTAHLSKRLNSLAQDKDGKD